MIGFENRKKLTNNVTLMGDEVMNDPSFLARVERIKRAWDFYEGYHWEDLDNEDRPENTVNFCEVFVDKKVAFELGKGFTTNLGSESSTIVNEVGETLYEYLETFWKANKKMQFCTELGQSKSVTGETWVRIRYCSPEEINDPFGEFPKGLIKINIVPTEYVFPYFDSHDKEKLEMLKVMYPIKKYKKGLFTGREETILYKQEWTNSYIREYEGGKLIKEYENTLGFIPFVQIKNKSIAGRSEGRGDLDNIIPLNIEYNLKKSDISEIIDYHASPVTVVLGAKISNIEKGANKVWGGLPKDAKVHNLEMQSDLQASQQYLANTKREMCEVASVPEEMLGGKQAISNTSGVALQFMNAPLIESNDTKKSLTEQGLEDITKIVLLISLEEGLITNPNNVSIKEFVWNNVTLPNNLPKDRMIELQMIQSEMAMQLETRRGALERLEKEDINRLLEELEEEYPDDDPLLKNNEINSGITNGIDNILNDI